MLTDLFRQQMQAIVDGDSERAAALAREAIRCGADLSRCVDEGYVVGIREVGRLWAEGEYFLPELIQGADAMKAAMSLLRPEFLKQAIESEDPIKVVIGTVQGDIHEIGKSLVGTVLEANGFRVIDLGSDVPDATFLEAAEGDTADTTAVFGDTFTVEGNGSEPADAEPLPDPIVYYRLDGTASLVRSRFLHLGLALEWREPVWDRGPVPVTPAPVSALPEDEAVTAPVKPDSFRLYRLEQSRPVRTGRMEYFDGPVIGVLAWVTEIEEPPTEEPTD